MTVIVEANDDVLSSQREFSHLLYPGDECLRLKVKT